jgi:hypothetical protein
LRPFLVPPEKENRWGNLVRNYLAWEPFLDRPNILTVRFEDLVASPEETMRDVYRHIGLDYSSRFLEPFERLHPKRFLWKTAVDWQSGMRKEFDRAKINEWSHALSDEQLELIYSDQDVVRFMNRFGYERET